MCLKWHKLTWSTPELRVILPTTSDGGMSDTRIYKVSASRAQTRASHKRARGKDANEVKTPAGAAYAQQCTCRSEATRRHGVKAARPFESGLDRRSVGEGRLPQGLVGEFW